MTVDVYAKGLDPGHVACDFGARHFELTIRDASGGGDDFVLRKELFADIEPAASRVEVLRTKVEVTLKKAAPAAWPGLEAAAAGVAPPSFCDPCACRRAAALCRRSPPPSWMPRVRCAQTLLSAARGSRAHGPLAPLSLTTTTPSRSQRRRPRSSRPTPRPRRRRRASARTGAPWRRR